MSLSPTRRTPTEAAPPNNLRCRVRDHGLRCIRMRGHVTADGTKHRTETGREF